MKQFLNGKILLVLSAVFFLSACTIYTEKRSQALSRAVQATADSVEAARIDLAWYYSKEAKRLAYAPKNKIEIEPLVTAEVKKVEATTPKQTAISKGEGQQIISNVITKTTNDGQEQKILRLVVPEKFKNAKLLVENSEEWNELLKTKDFAKQIEKENSDLKKLIEEIDNELKKQQVMEHKMVQDLNKFQKQILEKNLHILKLYIIIALLVGLIVGGIYLRMKGIL
jgi:hypothetical protein